MKLSWLSKARYLTAAAVTVATVSLIAACGGGTYESPTASTSWWSSYDQSQDTLVSATDVAGWIKNGYKTSDGSPVVILDVQTDFSTTANRIIGSTSISSIGAFTIFDYRAEGPVNSVSNIATSAKMVPKGATMDSIIQDMGVTKDTVIVLTSSSTGSNVYNLTRGWWMFYYWGFSESKLKVLNGGVAALAAADPTLVDTTTASVDPADSTFSVKDLPAMHDTARVTTKEVIDLVSTGGAVVIDARGSAAQATPGTGEAFQGRIKNAIVATTTNGIAAASLVNADGTFKTKAETEAAFTALGITSSKKIIVHCYSGYSATPIYYYIKEVLRYPNVALYDGSWSAWASHAGYTPVNTTYAGGTTATSVLWKLTQFVLASDGTTAVPSTDIVVGGPLKADMNSNILSYDTVKVSGNIQFNNTSAWKDVYGNTLNAVNPDYVGSGNEIETEDYNYMHADDATQSSSSSSESTSASPDSSGC